MSKIIGTILSNMRDAGVQIIGRSATRGYNSKERAFTHLLEAGIDLNHPNLPKNANEFLYQNNPEVGYENGILFLPNYSLMGQDVKKMVSLIF